jgi:hypothetical protein
MSRNVPPRHRSGWLYTVLTALVLTAQFVVAFAPLAESRDRRMDSHVESGGAQTHHVHDEAECASCQARSIHGSTTRPAVTIFAGVLPHEAIVAKADRAVASDAHSLSNPRAPPSVI